MNKKQMLDKLNKYDQIDRTADQIKDMYGINILEYTDFDTFVADVDEAEYQENLEFWATDNDGYQG